MYKRMASGCATKVARPDGKDRRDNQKGEKTWNRRRGSGRCPAPGGPNETETRCRT